GHQRGCRPLGFVTCDAPVGKRQRIAVYYGHRYGTHPLGQITGTDVRKTSRPNYNELVARPKRVTPLRGTELYQGGPPPMTSSNTVTIDLRGLRSRSGPQPMGL